MKTVEEWKALLRIKLREALGARQHHVIAVLRETLAALENAEAPPATSSAVYTDGVIAGSADGLRASEAPRLELSQTAVAAIIDHEIRERREAADEYAMLGRPEEATKLTLQVDVLEALKAEQDNRSR
jgi:uncharacterized protein YqeY